MIGTVRRLSAAIAVVALAMTTVMPAPAVAQEVPEIPTDPVDLIFTVIDALTTILPPDLPDPLEPLDPLNPACDPLDPAMCLFPFPSDRWTIEDPSTATGRRVDLPLVGMPRNVSSIPMVPTEWNRNDGFSPGSSLLTFVPGLDLVETWGLGDRAERYRDQITDLERSLDSDAPIVLVDATTGARHPFFSELDGHVDTPPGERTLVIRPAVNLEHGHRYVVGLRSLQRSDGSEIDAGAAFSALRAGTAGGARQTHYDAAVFPVLAAAGVDRDELTLAWDLTVISSENLAGRVLHMRDETFAGLGDDDLDDGIVAGVAPGFTIDDVEDRGDDDPTLRVVTGTIEVPNFLTIPDEAQVEIPELGMFPVPGARLNYSSLDPGPDEFPVVNAVDPTRAVPFVCSIPRTVETGAAAVPTLYGHGLLGSRGESTGGSTEGLRRNGHMPCAIDWTGMATGDVPNVALILAEAGRFPSLADRSQQGFVEFLVLGRALRHPDGLATAPAFQIEAQPVFDPAALVYDGNSQGAILGGAFAALGVDFTRVTLGVPGMNYSTLLNRSVDWEGAYGEINYAFYPDKREQQLLFALLQMLWDRGETNGYAHHLTEDPLPDTPAKQVLLQTAFGDHQVANITAEVTARTLGATRITADLPRCRHWSIDPGFGLPTHDQSAPASGVLAYFDSGTPTPPNDNTPPAGLGEDPHGDPRNDPAAIDQKITFFETGRVVDVAAGGHARTEQWPDRAGSFLDEVQGQVAGDCIEATAAAPGPTGPAAAPSGPVDRPGSTVQRLPATGSDRETALVLAVLAAGIWIVTGGARRRPFSTK